MRIGVAARDDRSIETPDKGGRARYLTTMNDMSRPPLPLPSAREPAINAPAVVLVLLGLLTAIHAVRLALPEPTDDVILVLFSFLPARYDPEVLRGVVLPGGMGAGLWTPLTYGLLHGSWTHLVVNGVWLLAFGSPVAWRFGTLRFVLFTALCSMAGAGLHLVFHWGDLTPVVGASAAISGHTAAALRFMFQPGAPLGLFRVQGRAAFRVPAHGLVETLGDRRVVMFLVMWFGVNLVFGMGAAVLGAGSAGIAWQAHVGGFLAGVLLFPLFDPVRSPA